MAQHHNLRPVLCGNEAKIKKAVQHTKPLFAPLSNIQLKDVQAAFGIALHMHQPTIPASNDNLSEAELISNLQYMFEHQGTGDNHNAPVFLWCYERISDFIRQLSSDGHNPRVMLDYSGNLLWGLEQMGKVETIEKLKAIAKDPAHWVHVEWLGTMWSHAVVSSTPVPDIKLHIHAWQEQFASLFGYEALARVKGFSPPEMHLPIHPDVCFEYVRSLRECGYEWLMVQEHTIELTGGRRLDNPYIPHSLVAKNSLGETMTIPVLIKTQGSDTKLVAQMQPYYEAQSKSNLSCCGKTIPPYVLQISDGENGGVMMNEFPPKYNEVFKQVGHTGVVAMNGSEYLEHLYALGIRPEQFPAVQPINQQRIWEHLHQFGPGAADRAIDEAQKKDPGFHLEHASWTNDRNWVKGYEHVMGPITALSAAFHACFGGNTESVKDPHYAEALLYVLLSQTSCFRYWGSGLWTDYAKEICRRGQRVLEKCPVKKGSSR